MNMNPAGSCSAIPTVLTLLLQSTLRSASTALLLRMFLGHLPPPQQPMREPEDCSPMRFFLGLFFFLRGKSTRSHLKTEQAIFKLKEPPVLTK